jgi:uracil-DNA glycosylase
LQATEFIAGSRENGKAKMLQDDIEACQICAERFAATVTGHRPRPIVWFRANTPILIAGQAPGMRVHEDGRPFWDRSGDRLRDWLGLDHDQFYDRDLVSILPTAFCFPGYDAKGSDLPPPPICWETWHAQSLEEIGRPKLRVIIGSYAISRHLGLKGRLGDIISDWREHAPDTFVLPHPSWRNSGWMRKHPWFEADILPALRARVEEII